MLRSGPRWQLGLGRENGLTFWAMMALEASFAGFFSFLPLYISSLGANGAEVGLIMGVWGGLRLLCLSLSGLLVDRFPPVWLILVTRGCGVLGLLFAALVPSWWLLPLALLGTSIGNIAFPAISSLIAGAAGERARARAFTLIYTAAPAIATVIIPLLAGAAAERFTLRITPLLAAGCSLVSIAIFSRLTPQPPPAHDPLPVSYRVVLAYGPIRTLCLLLVLTLLILTIGTSLAPNFLRQVHGLEYDQIGQLSSVAALGSILLTIACTRVRALQRPLSGITIATACTTLTFAVLLVAGNLPLFALAYLLRGGYMVAWSLFAASLGDVTPPRWRGRTFALGEIGGGLAMTVAPLLAGPLFTWRPAAPLAVALVAGLPLIAFLTLFARRDGRASRAEVTIGESTA